MRALGLLLVVAFAACAKSPAKAPAMPAEESYLFGPAENPEGGRIVVGLLLPTSEPKVLAEYIPPERMNALLAADREESPEEPIEEPAPEIPEEEIVEVSEPPGSAPWGERARNLSTKLGNGPRVVFREVTAEEIQQIPVVLVAHRERSDLEWAALHSYAAAGGLVGSLEDVEHLVRRAIAVSPLVRRLPKDPLAVVEARRDGDVVEVRLAEAPTGAALKDIEGHELWTQRGDPPNPLRFPCPEAANDPYACRLDLAWRGLRRSYRIVDLVGTTERHLFACNRMLAGGTFAARALYTNTKTGAPVAGHLESFRLERNGELLAEAAAASDASGTAEIRIRVPEDAESGPAELVVGISRFAVTVAREVSLSVVTDRGLYRPDDTVHVRVLAHRFPSGRPAAGETVTLRHVAHCGTDAERRVTLSENGIGSWSIPITNAPVGTHHVHATAEGASIWIRFDVRAFEMPRFLLALDPPEVSLRPGETVPVTLRARYVDDSPLVGGKAVVYGDAEPNKGVTDADGVFRFDVKAPAGTKSDSTLVQLTDADGRKAHVWMHVVIAGPEISIEPLGDLVAGTPCAFRISVRGASSAALSVDGGDQVPLALDEDGVATAEATPKGSRIALRVTAGGTSCGRELRVFVPEEGQPVLRLARREATVGESLAVEVAGPPGPLHLDLTRDGLLLRALTSSGPNARFEIDLDDDVAGLLTLHAYQGTPGTRAQVLVRRGRTLDVEARPERDVYRPRETASVDIAVRDREGRPAPAALGYWAVDAAVLALRRWPNGHETVFDALPGDSGERLRDAAESGGPALRAALGPIRNDDTQPHRIRHREAPDREAAAQRRAQQVLDAHVANLRAAYLAIFRDIPLTEVRAFASFRQQMRWLVLAGWLDPSLLTDPWGEPLVIWQEIAWAQLTWASDGPAGTASVSAGWCLERLWYDTPDRILRLYEAAMESAPPGQFRDLPFTGPSTNVAIGLGGGAGGGRRGRGGMRNLRAGGGSGLIPDNVTLRRDFPPTLVFVPEVLTDDEGRARLDIPLADSLTTWGMRVVASAADGATGVGYTSLRVTQPLSVEPWVASHLTVGDELDLPVALRSEKAATVRVRLECSPELEVVGGAGAEVEALAGATAAHTFRIRAASPGRATVRLRAEAGTERDAVERVIDVRPNAREVNEAVSFSLAAGSVKPSVGERGPLRLDLYPNPVAETLAGFDALVREPHGCFEQTSSTVYPMTLALSYLRRTGQSAPEVEGRAMRYLEQGYQRLLGFEVKGERGGFSLFGDAPASVFLSAYGLMEFTDLRAVYPVDPDLAPRVARFLVSKQREDGSWDGDFALTAYVAWALSVAGQPSPKALAWLDAHADGVNDPYRLALAALADPSGHAAAKARDARGAVEQTLVGAHGRSSEAETLALVLQALLASESRESGPLLDRLVSMRKASGSFGTTQATVQALRALLLAEASTPSADGRVEVRSGETLLMSREIEADAMEPLRVDLGDLPPGPLDISLSGERRLRGTLTRTTWEPWAASPAPGRVALDVRYPEEPVAVGRVAWADVVISNPTSKRARLVTAEIGLPPGCDAEASEILGKGALRIERGETTMVFYLPDLEPGAKLAFRIPFVPRHGIAVLTAPSKAYEYYTPEEAVVVPPALVCSEGYAPTMQLRPRALAR